MDVSWMPDACTLPAQERPQRAREFDELFGDVTRSVRRVSATTLQFELEAHPAVAGQAADLAVREAACCSFFTFTLTADGSGLRLDIAVPDDRTEILDGWERWTGA